MHVNAPGPEHLLARCDDRTRLPVAYMDILGKQRHEPVQIMSIVVLQPARRIEACTTVPINV